MTRRHARLSIIAAAMTLSCWPASSIVRAQQQGRGGDAAATQEPSAQTLRNVQVLPKDMAQGQVLQTMQNIASGLGVQCGYCHVAATVPEAAGRGRGRGRGAAAPAALDFPSDAIPQKKAAREMMLMVRDINQKVTAAVGKSADAATRVGCITCHRGVPIPKQLPEILDRTTTEKGTPEAIAQYKELRKRYFGAQAYDFSEATLVAYAQRAVQANKPDDAIAWLQTNLEYFPLSASTYAGLSQAQQRKNDKASALQSQEKAVDLDPQNAQFKRQLDQLKGQ
jgi:photosynthetic reaction center cytochrome c subunit